MSMNILVNLNISNDSNFEADSGYIFQKLIWEQICSMREDINVFLLGHKSMGEEWGRHMKIIPIFEKFDKYSTRFHFDWLNLREIVRNLPKIDLVINNQPEHSLALKLLLASEYNKIVPLVSYYHYLPFHYINGKIVFDESQNLLGFPAKFIMKKNLEAMAVSDLNLIGSDFGIEICRKACQEFYPGEKLGPFKKLPPPVEQTLFKQKQHTVKSLPKILYNQRLYKHYGTDKLVDILCDLAQEVRFELIVSDPTAKRSSERNRLDPHVAKIREKLNGLPFAKIQHGETREDYHSIINNIDIAIAPLKPSALWSMAVADVLAAGKPVLCPNVGAFPEIVEQTPGLLFDSESELISKLKQLIEKSKYSEEQLKSNVKGVHETQIAKAMMKIVLGIKL
ncbi:MAG: glycosyltransferase [Candidatus Gracilibacteria bacterium]